MFSKINNLDTAFRQVRSYCLILIGIFTSITFYALFTAYRIAARAEEKVFILSNSKVLEAFSAERKDNIPVEARDHVKMFHHYFFSLDPDDKVIENNMRSAFYLCDATAKATYDNLKEKGYYASLISGNVSQTITVDSVDVNTDSYPYAFTCYARQTITRPASVIQRMLITSGMLRSVARSDHNPHGFLIEKWKTIENKDVHVEAR